MWSGRLSLISDFLGRHTQPVMRNFSFKKIKVLDLIQASQVLSLALHKRISRGFYFEIFEVEERGREEKEKVSEREDNTIYLKEKERFFIGRENFK